MTNTAVRPERATGSTTRTNAENREAPSIIAASSSSRGMPSKKPFSIHVASGISTAM